MRRYLYLYIIALVSLVATSCNHKELCEDHKLHAHSYHIMLHADYLLIWEHHGEYMDWENEWEKLFPAPMFSSYDSFRPDKPGGLRVLYNNKFANNLSSPDGGRVYIGEGYNDILIYNNDTEYHIITGEGGPEVRATTRTKTRASYTASTLANPNEATKAAPWDILFANYHEGYYAEKTQEPVDFYTTLQPLVFTYVVRANIVEGLQHAVAAEGDLSGMAEGVNLKTGETSSTPVTILFDNTGDYTCVRITDYGIEAIVRSYGLPGYPNISYPTRSNKNILRLNIMLTNGKTILVEEDVTEQMSKQPHGGVIQMKDIVIKKEQATQGSGGFDVTVDDWGDYEDIVLPL